MHVTNFDLNNVSFQNQNTYVVNFFHSYTILGQCYVLYVIQQTVALNLLQSL